MQLRELFSTGEDFELRNARMYAHFSIIHGAEDERISAFWEQMSTDEWQHYIVLNYCRGMCEANGYLDKNAPEINQEALDRTYQLLDDIEKKIRDGKVKREEAFSVALELEEGEADVIFDTLVQITCEAVSLSEKTYLMERIRKAQKQSSQHADRLLKAVKKFSDSPELIRQAQEQLGNH